VGGGLAARTGRSQPRWLAAADVGSAAPLLGDLGADAPRPSPAGMAAKIQSLLADGRLGGQVTASVVDATSGEPIYELNGGRLSVPASTAKLATAAAVLHARGPAYRLATRVVEGSSPGEVVIVGGGDPTLAVGATASYPGAARLDELAEQVKQALGGTVPTRVVVDSSLFVGPTFGPSWFAQDARDGFIANITALMTDGARRDPKRIRPPASRYPRPDLAAGQLFARQLGLTASAVTFGTAPSGARQLGEVLSPPVSRLVEMMISESDNIVAEALARQVALVRGEAASFVGGVVATRDVLVELGIPIDGYGLVDGSGMSHNNRVSAQFLTAILAHAVSPDQPQLRSIVSGLPVAAYSGTLAERYRTASSGGAAKGVVRAKTGTLTGVNSLAGIVVDADGRLLAFSIIADKTTNTPQAQIVMDRIAAAIATCGCP
jgi:D-alanyl-D-alanine carboxypeptidase/D-alanyl-D-alanine-endopeptidase (penicillin-binding protein 4)